MKAGGLDGVFLHASAVNLDGGAVLFLGHSTAGKSTVARKLGAELPILADDSVYAAKDLSGGWGLVDGSFRFGRGWGVEEWLAEVRRTYQEGRGLPLRKCFRIHKADSARIEPLAPVELGRFLMDAAMEIDLQRNPRDGHAGAEIRPRDLLHGRTMRKHWFSQVADMARSTPGWHLWFHKETPVGELRQLIGI